MTYEEAARRRVLESAGLRKASRLAAAANPTKPWRAERDRRRLVAFEARLATERQGMQGAEAAQGETIDYQPVAFLSEGARVSHTVGLVNVKLTNGVRTGSGFMISPDLFITNHHVIESSEEARVATVDFNFELDPSRRSTPPTRFALDPDRCFITAEEDDLDFTVVAVGARLEGDSQLAAIGYCPLSDAGDKHAIGMTMNIVEHPEARPKCVVIRNNVLVNRGAHTLHYETDTDVGSSGSPVFNDSWDVVALHHWGQPFLERVKADGSPLDPACNEGVRISSIIERLRRERGTDELARRCPCAGALLDVALGLANINKPTKVPVIQMGSEANTQEASLVGGDGSLHATIPLEITLRIGAVQGGSSNGHDAGPPRVVVVAPKMRSPKHAPTIVISEAAAEKLVIDTSYANRKGYDPNFLDGFPVPLPVADPQLVAPLRQGANAAAGELLYEHFSVKLHQHKRMALFTATNVDGLTYIEIERTTGQPKQQEAGEKWCPDPRIDAKYFIDQTFYSEWSTYFDRGHLTRRSDPSWGDDDSAARANADTFHFTNCTPQHFRFNESAKFWQGVERYILEHGGVERKKRMCVLQGPVLRGAYAKCDDVEVPLKFWKIVAWVGATGPKVAGFLVSQEKLLDQERVGVMPANASTPIDVDHWRATIATIAKQTGLDFGELGKHDTFKDPGPVGEGMLKITNLDQLALT
jgi:endonuclease G, mitochondrial